MVSGCRGTILMSGGSGLLGSEFVRLNPEIIAPSRGEMDILDPESVNEWFLRVSPDVYIHAAAIVGTVECRSDPVAAMKANAGSVLTAMLACRQSGCRMVYISSDSVFERGLEREGGCYREEDPIGAVNIYPRSKIAGEMILSALEDHLIIRTSFVSRFKTKYKGAFCDQYTSRDFVDILAPQLLRAALSELIGTIHIGSHRRSQYDLLRIAFPEIRPTRRRDVDSSLTADSSLSSKVWRAWNSQFEDGRTVGEGESCDES